MWVHAIRAATRPAGRRERLRLFDLDDTQIGRLHGPVGLRLSSRTSAEIAVSVTAEIIVVKNHVCLDRLHDKRAGNSFPV